jgi:hypothetical protein
MRRAAVTILCLLLLGGFGGLGGVAAATIKSDPKQKTESGARHSRYGERHHERRLSRAQREWWQSHHHRDARGEHAERAWRRSHHPRHGHHEFEWHGHHDKYGHLEWRKHHDRRAHRGEHGDDKPHGKKTSHKPSKLPGRR